MMTQMRTSGLFFEAFEIGEKYYTDSRTVTETDLINFTTSFGFFEPLFMDKAYVEHHTPYKRRIVPGALTFSMAEGLTILSGIIRGTGIAFLGVELNVLKPFFVGDTLRVEIEIVAKRSTRKPEQGIVTFAHRVLNQDDQCVMAYAIKRMIRCRT